MKKAMAAGKDLIRLDQRSYTPADTRNIRSKELIMKPFRLNFCLVQAEVLTQLPWTTRLSHVSSPGHVPHSTSPIKPNQKRAQPKTRPLAHTHAHADVQT